MKIFSSPILFLSMAGAIAVCSAVTAVPQSFATEATASSNLQNICLAEARRAEAQHGIPAGLLQSISRVEAGRKTVTGEFMPWPWTLNDAGKGLFFDTQDAALKYLRDAYAKEGHSVDVGCMQVNTKWHADAFFDLADMMDPVQNADYAASFLLDLYAAHQSWDGAVKHYHSAEPAKNGIYHSRVLAELERYLDQQKAGETAPEDPVEMLANMVPDAVMPATASANGVEMGSAEPEFQDDTASMSVARPAIAIPPAMATSSEPVSTDLSQQAAAITDAPTADAPTADVTNSGVTNSDVSALSEADPDMKVKERQPYLARQWDRVESFRAMLADQAG